MLRKEPLICLFPGIPADPCFPLARHPLPLLFFLTPENTHAADTTAKIHILTLDSGSNAIVLESVDDNGQKIFGMVDSGEDWDYPDGSDPRYPLRSGITTSTGYDDEVLSYLDSSVSPPIICSFMLQHIRTATILEPAIPSCGCIPRPGLSAPV